MTEAPSTRMQLVLLTGTAVARAEDFVAGRSDAARAIAARLIAGANKIDPGGAVTLLPSGEGQ